LTPDEAVSFERHDHPMDRGRADLKVVLHIGLGGPSSETVRRRLAENGLKPWRKDM
jgi:hypothetical protein